MSFNKVICLVLAVILMLCIVSCGTSTKKESNEHVDSTTNSELQPVVVDDRILDIIDVLSSYGTTSNSVNLRNPIIIPGASKVSVTAAPSKELSFFDKSNTYSYVESIKRNLEDVIIHEYENEGTIFRINEHGDFSSIGNNEKGILNIELDTISQDSIKEKAEKELSKWISFEGFELYSVSELGTYTYMYTRSINGYVTEWISYTLRTDGTLTYLSRSFIPSLDESQLSKIDKKLESELLELKLKDLYETDDTVEITDYTIGYTDAAIYEGSTYINYGNIEVQLKKDDGSTTNKHCHNLLIPITSLIPAK